MSGVPRQGGDWLQRETASGDVMTPETLSGDHRLVGQTAAEFVVNEVLPATEDLERKDWDVGRRLIGRCGELGLLGTDSPESLGGIGLDKAAAVMVVEAIGAAPAFSTMFGAQTSLALIPLLCFGSPEQQARYLTPLLDGTIVGAYCLSESGAGSDALGLRARAERQPDGTWRLNGEKMWTTNGGFADLFVVFAKVDGEHISAFLVERGFAGVSTGQEEHKMGLQGSSTTPLVLSDARVPAGNLLGEVGRGHKIAFNVLNYGRFKLAAMCSGGAKAAITEAARYAGSRRQFGRPIASFGAIGHKLAEMTIRAYVVESMLYRTAGLIDAAIGDDHDRPAVMAAALEEFAVEASLLKIASSEMLDYVVDENVQIHGGNGFVRDYPAERRFRDARVNRIFEGTNEINRLLVPARLLKRAAQGGPKVLDEPDVSAGKARPTPVEALRRAARTLLRDAASTLGKRLSEEQEITMLLTDVLLAAFAAESAVLRAEAAERIGHPLAELHAAAARTFVHDAGRRVHVAGSTAIEAIHTGQRRDEALRALTSLLDLDPFDTIAARRAIAAVVNERQSYIFG